MHISYIHVNFIKGETNAHFLEFIFRVMALANDVIAVDEHGVVLQHFYLFLCPAIKKSGGVLCYIL